VFHHARCFGCFPLGFGNSGWWFGHKTTWPSSFGSSQ
jgi:hypothetical protein